ncbi:MAG: ABC transporter permease subunit [Sarcina sp.]
MAKKILNLTYNEVFKQIKKKSVVCMLAGILATSAIVPIGTSLIEKNKSENITGISYYINGNVVKSYSEAKNIKQQLEYKLNVVNEEYNALIKSNKYDSSNWINKAGEQFKSLADDYIVYQGIIDGATQADIENLQNIYVSVDQFFGLSAQDKKKELDLVAQKAKKLEEIIKNKDYVSFLNLEKVEYESSLENSKKEIVAIDKKIENTKNDSKAVEELKRTKTSIEEEITRTNFDLKIVNYRINHKITFDNNDWKNKTLKAVIEAESVYNRKPLDEKALLQTGENITYKDYMQRFEAEKAKAKKVLDEGWYSLDNNIPQMQYLFSARESFMSSYDIIFIATILMIIIIGSGIVSNEFNTGTIRMLAMRPVSRTKILLSKLLALILIGFATLALGVSIIFIINGCMYGFSDYAIPVITMGTSGVVAMPFAAFAAKSILFSGLSVLFMTVLTFTLSVFVRNTAIASVVALLTYILPIGLIMFMPNGVLGNTFIPSIVQSMQNLVPSIMEVAMEKSGLMLNQNLGFIQLIAIMAVMLIASIVIFNKKDIKN